MADYPGEGPAALWALLKRWGPPEWAGGAAAALVFGALLAVAGAYGAIPLLVAVAILQIALAVAWVYGVQLPGRKGALVIAVMAAAAADVTVWVWPHSRLGALLAVFGLAVPVLFVHQLMRGAARHRIVASLGIIAALVLAEVGPAALLQLRHEFTDQTSAGRVVATVAAVATAGLVVGFLVDAASSAPRFDPEVPRGLLGVLAAAGLGGSIGYLALQSPRHADFSHGRGALVGAVVGALVALLAVAASFAAHSVEQLPGAPVLLTGRMRVLFTAVVPLAFLAPVAFLLCIAVRT